MFRLSSSLIRPSLKVVFPSILLALILTLPGAALS